MTKGKGGGSYSKINCCERGKGGGKKIEEGTKMKMGLKKRK